MERQFTHEIASHRRKPEWMTKSNDITARGWISRFRNETAFSFIKRDIFFLITHGDSTLAAGTLTVWKASYEGDRYRDLSQFVQQGDCYSNSAYETALAIARIWGSDDDDNWWTDEPFCYGEVCIFDKLVVEARTSGQVDSVWHAINTLINRVSGRTAVMMAKAFPLEYEGRVTDKNRPIFQRRQHALIRLYRRRLRLEPVPHSELAEEGWMFRLFKEGARPFIER